MLLSTIKFLVFFFLLAIANFFSLFAQEKDIKFTHITVENGLGSNIINSVIRDSRGFIWIASENGVQRYDGYTFEDFRSHVNDVLGISSNITYVVFEDRQERIWVGSEKGLDLYNRKLDRFDQHFFKDTPVRSIYQDRKDRLWIGSDHGLFQYDENKQTFIKPFRELFDSNDIDYNTISSMIEDSHGNLWVGTYNGCYIYNWKKKSFSHLRHNPKIPGSLSENNVREVVEDSKGRIWIATYGGGINLFEPQTQTFKVYKHDINDPEGLSSNFIPTLWADNNGKLWIGTDGKGIDIFDPDNDVFLNVVHAPYNSKSLSSNVIRSISSDMRGGVWIGTYYGGINFFNQNAEAFFHYKVQTINGSSSVTSFAEEENGNLWIGTDGGGLCYFNRKTGQFSNQYNNERNDNSLSDNRIQALLLDHDGMLWIGTYQGGLCRYDPKTKKYTRFSGKDDSGLNSSIIWTLLKDSRHRIWAGTNNGLRVYDAQSNKFKSLDIDNSNLSNNMIRCMYEDTKSRLWVGTQEGLNLLEYPYERFTVIKSDVQKEHSLSNHWIRTITEDVSGNIWIGTLAGGLNMFNESSNTFITFSEEDGLPDSIISGILGDIHNNLWISTSRGLAYLDTKTKKFKTYNVSDGLQDYQFIINASFKTQKGEFLFGGNNGFTLFIPDVIKQVESNKFPPQIALTKFKIFNKEVIPGQPGSPLHEQINETKLIKLTHDQTVLTFEFAALNFIQPEKNRYAYRLEGFEDDWNPIDNKRSATYTNLEPGHYTFRVKAANNDGVWNEDGVSIKVIIAPPFWDTLWFKTILVIVVCAITLMVLDIIRKRIREKIRINKIIAELELKALITQMNPHFIFNCLTSIQELIIVHKQQEAMHYLHQFSRLLRTVLQCSEKNFIPLDEELTLLELYLELESMRFDKQFHYRIDVDPAIDPEEFIIPSFLLQPFVENALWHGLMHKKGDRHLTISFILEEEDVLSCKITDNGIGREHASKIKKESVKAYQSMGLKIIRDRIALMKKQNSVFNLAIIDEKDASDNPAGTTVIVTIPLNISDYSDKTYGFDSEQVEIKRQDPQDETYNSKAIQQHIKSQ
jgi:ligand-binding sensor domain-containing protein